jgi:hypothetical protein
MSLSHITAIRKGRKQFFIDIDEVSSDVESIEEFSPDVEDLDENEPDSQETSSDAPSEEKKISVSIERLRKMVDEKEN